MIINNEHKLCRAFDRLFKIRNTLKLCTLYTARVTILAYHIIRASADYRSRGEHSTTEPRN